MWNWLSVRCPVSTAEKTWTEWRMKWLADRLGIERLLNAKVILPSDEFFPDAYSGTPDDARRIMDFLCRHMSIDPAKIELEVCLDVQLPDAIGHYDRSDGRVVIRLRESQLKEPESLVSILAHELAHEMLLGGGLLAEDVEDHEHVTDLLPVFLGLGVFASNSKVIERWENYTGLAQMRSIQGKGYMSMSELAYAQALFAFMRREASPAWAKYLRRDAATFLHSSLRYLHVTRDLLFHPDTVHQPTKPLTLTGALERLRTGSPTVRLSTLWEIHDQKLRDSELARAAAGCLRDRDRDIRPDAARTLAMQGELAADYVPDLIDAMRSSRAELRTAAARAVGELRLLPETVIPELCELLRESNRSIRRAAAEAFAKLGVASDEAVPLLLGAFKTALVECDDWTACILADALAVATRNPAQSIQEYFDGNHQELRPRAKAVLNRSKEAREEPAQSAKPGILWMPGF